jgi:hypothetical protein
MEHGLEIGKLLSGGCIDGKIFGKAVANFVDESVQGGRSLEEIIDGGCEASRCCLAAGYATCF